MISSRLRQIVTVAVSMTLVIDEPVCAVTFYPVNKFGI